MTDLSIKNILTLDSQLYNDCNDIQAKLSKLSNYLLNHVKLVVKDNSSTYRLVEIELYLYTDSHADIFTHRHQDQKTPYRFYFHKMGHNYKSGTYKGLDITFGYSEHTNMCYGGALIRSVENLNDHTIIQGPCLVVNELMKLLNYNDIGSMVSYLIDTNNQNDNLVLAKCYKTNNNSKLYIEINNLDQREIYMGPRVGLTLKRIGKTNQTKRELMEQYLMAYYRYLTIPKEIKKFRSGIILYLHKNNKIVEDIEDITESKKRIINNYIAKYNLGISAAMSFSNYHGKRLGVTDYCILQGIHDINN